MADVTREQLEKLAKQMNEGVLSSGEMVSIEPPIDFSEDVPTEDLKKAVMKELPEVQPEDEFSEENWETINTLRGKKTEPKEEPKAEKTPPKKTTKKVEPEHKPIEKKSAKKAPAKKPETDAPEKKPAKKVSAEKKVEKKVEKKEPKATTPKKEKTEKYTRSQALADALQAGPATKKEIVELSDKLFVEKAGGKPNPTVSEAMFRYGVPLLKILGHAEETDGIISLKKTK